MITKEEIYKGKNKTECQLRWNFNFSEFCKDVLKLTIKPFHQEWCDLIQNEQRLAISAPTSYGKSQIFGIAYPIWQAYFKPKSESLIVSKVVRGQSQTILEKIKICMSENELLKDLIPKGKDREFEFNKERMVLTNGAKIYLSAYSANVRGTHVDYIFGDEVACVSLDTECLTSNGWKKYDEISENDLLATYNVVLRKIEFYRPNSIYVCKQKQSLFHIKNKSVDMMLTSNHRNIVYDRNNNVLVKDTLALGTNMRFILNADSDYSKDIPELSEDLSELLGWVISEGHYHRNGRGGISIYQNIGGKYNRIKKLLTKLNINHTEHLRNNKEGSFYLGTNSPITQFIKKICPTKELTTELAFLPKNKAIRLYESLILGDGHIKKVGLGKYQTFIQKSKKTIDNFTILAFRLGYKTNVLSRNGKNKTYSVSLMKKDSVFVSKPKISKKVDFVWCPNVPNGTWVARRNGKIFITGNTYPDKADDYIIWYRDFLSRVEGKGGKVAAVSTPIEPGDLITLLMNKKGWCSKVYSALVDKEGKPTVQPYTKETAIPIWPERHSFETLMRIRDEQGIEIFERNYQCDPKAAVSKAIYNMKDITFGYDSSLDFTHKNSGGLVFIGADFAMSDHPDADKDAFVIIEKLDEKIIIKHMETHHGIPVEDKISRLIELAKLHQPFQILCDSSNVGKHIVQKLLESGWPTLEVPFGPKTRKEMLSTLKIVFGDRKVVIPYNKDNFETIDMAEKLTLQLVGFREEKSAKTRLPLFVSTAVHDDLAMALALAISGAQEQDVNIGGFSSGNF